MVVHRNCWDTIVGTLLEGKARKIRSLVDYEPIIYGNTCIFQIDRRGGKIASCEIKKTMKREQDIPQNLRRLNIFTASDDCLEGNSLYCECEDGKCRHLPSFSARHGGRRGIFKSKRTALSIIFEKFVQSGVYELTDVIELKKLREEVV